MPRPASGAVVERQRKRGRVFALRFRAAGERQFETLGSEDEGWTSSRAEEELKNRLAQVRLGVWQPPRPEPVPIVDKAEPIFWEFARGWLERREHEVDARTVEHWEWALNTHLRDPFGRMVLSAIDVQTVDAFKAAKVRERHALDEQRRKGQKVTERGLSHGSINKTLKVLAQVLDDAVEYGHLDVNPARGKKRRLKAAKPKRTWLELDEVYSLLDAVEGQGRAMLATMTLAGLRVSEATGLRWRAVDTAKGTLTVEESKTEAGEGRKIDLTPMLRELLTLHRANSSNAGPDDLVFPTGTGTEQHRANVGSRVLGGAIKAANAKRAKVGLAPIQEGVTNHTLRRTFASLLYEAEASPAYVMSQMGHTSSALALEVYARKMERNRDTGAKIDALVKGADWALLGTNDESLVEPLSPETAKAPR